MRGGGAKNFPENHLLAQFSAIGELQVNSRNSSRLLPILAFFLVLTSCIDEPPEPRFPSPLYAPPWDEKWDLVPYAFVLAAQEGMTDSVRTYLQAGVEMNERVDGTTALIMAAKFGHQETLELLLQEGADPYATDSGDVSALIWAQRSGHEELVQILTPATAEDGF
jgi:hypothetical protein